MKKSISHTQLTVYAAILFWTLSTLTVVLTECRFPGTDVFLFKEAGVRLATHGTFTAKNLNHMPFEQELPYANYTPVYPFSFGIWSSVLGVGLKQSLLFDCLLKGIRSLLLVLLAWPILTPILLKPEKRRWAHLFILFTSGLSLISTDSDRPDELGIIFGLLSWIILRSSGGNRRVFLSSVFLGLCAATSPACGVAFGMGVGIYYLVCIRTLSAVLVGGLGTVGTFLACTLPIFYRAPGMFGRFLESARASSLTYLSLLKSSKDFSYFWKHCGFIFDRYYIPGVKYIFCSLILALVGIYILRKNKSRPESCFLLSALLYFPLSFLNWGLQPYYLWFSCLPIAILCFSFALNLKMIQLRIISGFIVLAFVPLFVHESKNFVLVFQRAESQSTDQVRLRLLKHIKPNERVALSYDQFFTLKNDREVADLNFVCRVVEGFDYIYATDMRASKKNENRPKMEIPCWSEAIARCFVPIEDLSLISRFRIFSWESPYSIRGHGGILYKNLNCPSSLVASKTNTEIKKARSIRDGSGLIRLLAY